MKKFGKGQIMAFLMLTIAVLLIIVSVVMLVHTFSQYNDLSLKRQDDQMAAMAQAVDASMARELNDLHQNLRYVIGRRGFLQAEKDWEETGDTADILARMQENLISSNPLNHTVLAIRDEKIVLSSGGGMTYFFPDGMEGDLRPCFSSDGEMYLALFEEGRYARYAVLVCMSGWYEELSRVHASENTHLLLLGRQRRILLHRWQNELCVNVVDELTTDNCDLQAIRGILECHTTGRRQSLTYHLQLPGEKHIHEMRMNAIPLQECANGYFVVGLTSDYDEIIVPMQTAAWWLLISGALLVLGVLMIILMIVVMVRQSRRRDIVLDRLRKRNRETQLLLEKTTELAHHQRLETIGTLTASIAHEFNNLLTPIMGYSILTLEGLPEECVDLTDNVVEIYEASRKAKEIISRLNALSRKSTETTFTPLALSGLVEKALQVTKPAQPAGVETFFNRPADELIIPGNETQLSQLLLNLIINAYHAMEKTGGSLTINIVQEGECAVLRVKDDGEGIPQEALHRIFDPFFTTKEAGRGTGLGLAIAHQVVENHQGTIAVESQPGQGTVFTVRLPLKQQEDEEA